jgi:Family of unknown function (DUF6489)
MTTWLAGAEPAELLDLSLRPADYRCAVPRRRGVARERHMKLNITVDCTPEEARAFLGLPDVSPINDTLVASVKQRIEQNVELVSPEFYLKQWYSMGGQATDSFMQMLAAGARAASGETPGKKT